MVTTHGENLCWREVSRLSTHIQLDVRKRGKQHADHPDVQTPHVLAPCLSAIVNNTSLSVRTSTTSVSGRTWLLVLIFPPKAVGQSSTSHSSPLVVMTAGSPTGTIPTYFAKGSPETRRRRGAESLSLPSPSPSPCRPIPGSRTRIRCVLPPSPPLSTKDSESPDTRYTRPSAYVGDFWNRYRWCSWLSPWSTRPPSPPTHTRARPGDARRARRTALAKSVEYWSGSRAMRLREK